MTQAVTLRDLRQHNRAAVVRKIVLDGKSTRAGLAASCGLSPATVTNVVADLMRDGLVQGTGLRRPRAAGQWPALARSSRPDSPKSGPSSSAS